MATKAQIQALQSYNACDISDALLKLKVPNCGFLPDLQSYAQPPAPASASASASASAPTTTSATQSSEQVLIAPASTVLFAPKTATSSQLTESGFPVANIPEDSHYVDLTQPETIVVISQPQGQICAVLGGIMSLRMKVCGAKGIVVHGRVRDVQELASTGLPIWARGKSITGAGGEAKPHAVQVPLNLDGTIVKPGDLVFMDSINGAVIIPQNKVSEVVDMLPGLVGADDRVKEDVAKGLNVREAFKKHRG